MTIALDSLIARSSAALEMKALVELYPAMERAMSCDATCDRDSSRGKAVSWGVRPPLSCEDAEVAHDRCCEAIARIARRVEPHRMAFARERASPMRLGPPPIGAAHMLLPARERSRNASEVPSPRPASPRLPMSTSGRSFQEWQMPVDTYRPIRVVLGRVDGRVQSPRAPTKFVANDRGHILDGTPRLARRPRSAGPAVFAPRETYPWRTSMPLPASLSWGESVPPAMRLGSLHAAGKRAPTAWRADRHQSYRWPDEANKPTRELLRDCKESEVLAKDLAAMIRPACVARVLHMS